MGKREEGHIKWGTVKVLALPHRRSDDAPNMGWNRRAVLRAGLAIAMSPGWMSTRV